MSEERGGGQQKQFGAAPGTPWRRKEHIGDATLYLADCMDIMRDMPDKAFELAIVDPPYGINIGEMSPTDSDRRAGRTRFNKSENVSKQWDSAIPPPAYFKELMRVTENQIIWGGNYFNLPPSRTIVCWDKQQFMPSFSQHELAWTSFNLPAPLFKYNNGTGDKIHPTQKPVALYKWLLSKYAHEGDKILDTHGGSGSSVIACLDMGYSITWIEKDEDYFNAALERIKIAYRQPRLFEEPRPKAKQGELI